MQINSTPLNTFAFPNSAAKPAEPNTATLNTQRDAGGEKSVDPGQQALSSGIVAEQRVSGTARVESTELTMETREAQAQGTGAATMGNNNAINQYLQTAQNPSNPQGPSAALMGVDIYV